MGRSFNGFFYSLSGARNSKLFLTSNKNKSNRMTSLDSTFNEYVAVQGILTLKTSGHIHPLSIRGLLSHKGDKFIEVV
jgi:hypothetical protein